MKGRKAQKALVDELSLYKIVIMAVIIMAVAAFIYKFADIVRLFS